MSLRAFSEQFQLIYTPGTYFEWFLLNMLLCGHQHFPSHWAVAVPSFAWCPLSSLSCSCSPAASFSSRLCLQPFFGYGRCLYQLPDSFDGRECDTTNSTLWELNLIIYNTAQCLAGRGTVQGVFNLSNHKDYSQCSLVSESLRFTAWALLHPISWCRTTGLHGDAATFCLMSVHELTTCLDTGREKGFAVKPVQTAWCLFRKVEIVKRLPQNLIYFGSKKIWSKFLDYISHCLNWMGRL